MMYFLDLLFGSYQIYRKLRGGFWEKINNKNINYPIWERNRIKNNRNLCPEDVVVKIENYT